MVQETSQQQSMQDAKVACSQAAAQVLTHQFLTVRKCLQIVMHVVL